MIRSFRLFRSFHISRRNLVFNRHGISDLLKTFPTYSSKQYTHSSPLNTMIESLVDSYKPLQLEGKIIFMKSLVDNIPKHSDTLKDIATTHGDDPCTQFIHTIALHPKGLELVLELRTDLKQINTFLNKEIDYITELTNSIHQVVSLWSRRAFLTFRLVTTDSPVELVDNIIQSEAVHPLSGKEEFNKRVTNGMCYAVTHDQLSPNIPISMAYCGLIDYFPTHIQPVLNGAGFKPNILQNPSTACFYTISNAHVGFSGTEVSHQLIKYAVNSISTRFPSVCTFVTLSPIPQFRNWLVDNNILFCDQLEVYSANKRRELLSECAKYLVKAKRGKRVFDPVANFHLKNGAILRKINWLANPNERGIQQSFGIMANYLYEVDYQEKNRIRYLQDGIVSISEDIKQLLHK
ncbi:Decarboxylase [Oopsacas minuta]|uniref:Decarboxylase n=1 Tax=Oopsacas minuta TaxID=111878 RepID=A0AAV7K9H5_9METZ|nr:Decarboxylase [Oopsacas minuta]